MYKVLFITFYNLRKLFNQKRNVEYAIGIVGMVQMFQLFAILDGSIYYLGLPDIVIKLKYYIVIIIIPLLFILLKFFIYTPANVDSLLEIDKALTPRKKVLNIILGLVISIVSFIVFVKMTNMYSQLHKS